MLFRFAPPARLEIVADGRTVAVRDQKLDTQDLYFIAQTPLKFLLADHIDIAKDTRVKRVAIDDNAATIEIEDKATFGGTAEIALVFDPDSFALKQWTVLDAQGFQTVVTLFNVDLTTKPDPDLFHINESPAERSNPQVARRAKAPRASPVGKSAPALASAPEAAIFARPSQKGPPLRFSISTWNINSVRLRIGLVARYLDEQRPDVLCLQETKCPDAQFPHAEFRQLGYAHVAINGQKGYHGVAIVSKLPIRRGESRASFAPRAIRATCAATLGGKAGGLEIHNFYVPAGGDEPDPASTTNSPTSSPSSTK